jgi:hypothetical protein
MKKTLLILVLAALSGCQSPDPKPAVKSAPPLPPMPVRRTAVARPAPMAPEAVTAPTPFNTRHVFGITFYTTNDLPIREWINGEMLPPITGHSKPLEIVSSEHHTVVVYWEPPTNFTWEASRNLTTWTAITTTTNIPGTGSVLLDLNSGYAGPYTFYKATTNNIP